MVKKFSILDIFKGDEVELQNDGCSKVECPSCGLQGGRTKGLILFPDGDRAYCHSSGKNFNILEAYALKHKIITCNDGRGTGEKGSVLKGDLFVQTCDHFRNTFNDDDFNQVADSLGLKEEIQLPGIISKFAVELGKKIGPKNILFYRPELADVFEIGKVKHVDGTIKYTGFISMSPSRFVTLSENFFNPWKKIFTKQGEMIVYESMPQNKAKIVLDSDQFRNLMPIINRILGASIPIEYKGTLTFPKKYYDERFGSWLPADAPMIEDPNMPLDEAVTLLRWIYSEFCFKEEEKEENLSRAISALLTPFLKGLMPKFSTRTPIYCYTANRERSGKDYCAGVTGILYEGMALEDPPFSDGEKMTSGKNDELKKKILSLLMQGRQRFHSSNNKGLLDSAVLESISTAEVFSERELGKSKTHSLENEMCFSLSGNQGITFTADLMNRSIFIELFLDIEDANQRNFDTPDLHGWVLRNRGKVLSALFALVRNWMEMGKPDGSIPFASFPHWAKICGGIMESAGFKNPCIRSQKTVIIDSNTGSMKQLFELCNDKYPNDYIKKSDIIDVIKEYNSDMDNDSIFGYIDWSDKSDVTKFWFHFKKYIGRIFSGITLKISEKANAARNEYWFCGTKKEVKTDKSVNLVNLCQGLEGPNTSLGKNMEGQKVNKGVQRLTKEPSFIKDDPKSPLFAKDDTIPKVKIDTTNLELKKKVNQKPEIKEIDAKLLTGNEETKKMDKKNVGTDRELQFYDKDCWDTKDMGIDCTKDDVKKWINENPGKSFSDIYLVLGNGSAKYYEELLEEDLIEEKDGRIYGKEEV